MKIGIIIGSTRPNRVGEQVGRWVFEQAKSFAQADYELIDLKTFNLPLLDEPMPPSKGQYTKPHTIAWSQKIDALDGFVFVTPEYNHGTSGALKNALDFIYREWNNKACAFVSYGSAGGSRAVEQLRLVAAELQMATVRSQVMFSLFTDFENFTTFRPDPRHSNSLQDTLGQVVKWSGALKSIRTNREAR